MQKYEEKKFNIGELKGISQKNTEEHLKLYAGYVKNTNFILEKLAELSENSTENAYIIGELQRRFSFEWNGMKNHEYYFESLSGGANPLKEDSVLKKKLEEQFGTFEKWLAYFKQIAPTRGVGWAVLYYDEEKDQLVHSWIDEQHLGHLSNVKWILGIDMWEHAYVYDYPTSEKAKYVEAFFENLNWEIVEGNFMKAKI